MGLVRALSVFVLGVCAAGLLAQPARPPAKVIGAVTAVDAASRAITLKTDDGATVALTVREDAPVVRVPPGARDLKSAARIGLADVGAGDRVAATVHQLGGKEEAGSLIVIKKADLELQRRREQDDWRKRGTAGIVTAVYPSSRTLIMRVGPRSVTVELNAGAGIRRYAQDSVKFSDARPCSLAEIHEGDRARVLGDRSADGVIKAEQVVSGSFRQIAGTVRSIDPVRRLIEITDLATKQPLTVRIDSESTLKKLPPAMAAMLAHRFRPGGAERASGGRGIAAARGGESPAKPPDLSRMLDRLPDMALSDLKPGDAVLFSSTQGSDPQRVTAIMLLAGVEPLLTASPTATRDLMNGWLSGGGAGDQGGDLGMSQ